MGGACSTYGGKGEVYTGFWWGNLTERDNSEDPGVDGRIILRFIFRMQDGGGWAWNRLTWFKIRTGGGLL